MQKTILAILCFFAANLQLFAEPQKVYRVNIKNFKEEERNFKEMAIAADRLYFFSQETNMLYCYGATDKKEIWHLFMETLSRFKQYTGLAADKMGRCILVAPQPKGVTVMEISNLGKLAGEHKFPELNLKNGKFTLFNGSILFNGKEAGKLKTNLVFVKEERNELSDYGLKAAKPVALSNSEFKINVTAFGKVKYEFSFTLKFNEPTTITRINPIRIDNFGRAYFHIITTKDYRESEEIPEEIEFKNIVMLTDLKGAILYSMEPMSAFSSMVTADDDGKILEVYTVKDPDRKKSYIRKAYYWYVKYKQ